MKYWKWAIEQNLFVRFRETKNDLSYDKASHVYDEDEYA